MCVYVRVDAHVQCGSDGFVFPVCALFLSSPALSIVNFAKVFSSLNQMLRSCEISVHPVAEHSSCLWKENYGIKPAFCAMRALQYLLLSLLYILILFHYST